MPGTLTRLFNDFKNQDASWHTTFSALYGTQVVEILGTFKDKIC